MDKVVKGDITDIRNKKESLGIPLNYLIDEKLKHNAIFYASLIKDESKCLEVIKYLIDEGLNPTSTDQLK